MTESSELRWGPFRLMGRHGPLLQDDQPIKLQSKTLSVLWMLARQPGVVVSKSELMDAVWPGLVVGDDALTFQIQILRRALGDEPRDPRYIQTVHRVGFRLRTTDIPNAAVSDTAFVGRTSELDKLTKRLRLANAGERQFVFISGEAGIGKTALVDQFVATQTITSSLAIGRGQCVEQSGINEAFLPFLQAMQQLLRNSLDDHIVQLLRRMAPSWLVQMPGLLDASEYNSLKRQTSGTPEARMLREMIEVLDSLTAEHALLLIIEDIHWSDHATLELLSRLASQRVKARIMVLCTLRPSDAIIREHPARRLQLDLRGRGFAHDLLLGHLQNEEVSRYVTQRLGSVLASDRLIAKVLERSNGHPLFMTQISEYLHTSSPKSQDEALALSAKIPQGLRDLIELQLLQLDQVQQKILETAAVAGFEFTTAAVAAASGLSVDVIEHHCEKLAKQQQFLTDAGLSAWPDGTLSGRYHFRHALHQITLRERMASARQGHCHRLMAERLETAYGARSTEIASELALHFESGELPLKAATYCMLSARTSSQRSAPTEVLSQAQRGLELLESTKKGKDTAELELALHSLMAGTLQTQRSHSRSQAKIHLERIEKLLPQAQEPQLIEFGLWLLWMSHHMQADFKRALEYAEYTLQLARKLERPALECAALSWDAFSAYNLGRFEQADRQSQAALKVISGVMDSTPAGTLEAGCAALSCSTLTRWMTGYPDLARKHAFQASQCLQNIGNPYNESITRSASVINLLLFRREYESALELCEMALPLCERQGAQDALQWTRVQHAVSRCMMEGSEDALAYLRAALDLQYRTGTLLNLPIGYLHEAEFCIKRKRVIEARTALDNAFGIITRGVRAFESEALRLDGELTALENPKQPALAEKKLKAALSMAHKRGALSLELRCGMSLARLLIADGKPDNANKLLNGIYTRFTEGFETRDLVEARGILDAVTSSGTPQAKRVANKKTAKAKLALP